MAEASWEEPDPTRHPPASPYERAIIAIILVVFPPLAMVGVAVAEDGAGGAPIGLGLVAVPCWAGAVALALPIARHRDAPWPARIVAIAAVALVAIVVIVTTILPVTLLALFG
jgi:hypothetical protein